MSTLMAWGKSPMRTELNKLPDQMAKVECQAETGRWASAKVWALVRRNWSQLVHFPSVPVSSQMA